MKIIIDEVALPLLSDNEKKYLALLEVHEGFQKSLLSIRRKLSIKVDESGRPRYKEPNPPNEPAAERLVVEMVDKLKLHPAFISCYRDLVVWGRIFSVVQPFIVLGVEFQVNRKMLYHSDIDPKPRLPRDYKQMEAGAIKSWQRRIGALLNKTGQAPALPILQVNKKVDKETFIKHLDSKWSDIEAAMDEYEDIFPQFKELDDIKPDDLKRDMEILKLKRKGMTHQQIADELVFGHDYVRERYSKFTKLLLKLHFVE